MKLPMPWGNFCVLFEWEKVDLALNKGNPPLVVVPGQLKTRMNSNRRQTVDRGKVNPRVTDLPGAYEQAIILKVGVLISHTCSSSQILMACLIFLKYVCNIFKIILVSIQT